MAEETKAAAGKKAAGTKERKTGKGGKIAAFFRGVRTEYRKIIWPTRENALRESGAVVFFAVLMGVAIAVIDYILKTGLGLVIK